MFCTRWAQAPNPLAIFAALTTLALGAGCTEVALTELSAFGDFCGGTEECETGLVCIENACGLDALRLVNEDCASDDWCAAGLVCDQGRCRDLGIAELPDIDTDGDVAGPDSDVLETIDDSGDIPETETVGPEVDGGADGDATALPDLEDDGETEAETEGDGDTADGDDGVEADGDDAELPDIEDGEDGDDGFGPDGEIEDGDAADGDAADGVSAGPGIGDPCDGDCLPGLVCMPDGFGGAACETFGQGACAPCVTDGDCPLVGAVCIPEVGGASFCGAPCSSGANCASGFLCLEGQCRPETLSCACTEGLTGFTLPCNNITAAGSCNGVVLCSAESWSTCTAKPATEEACDGLDNDCDGFTDEEPFYIEEGMSLAFGSPCGIGQCEGGEVICAPDGSATCSTNGFATAEACADTLDNNCDGATNEGCLSTDFDGDGVENDIDCAPLDAAVYQGAPEPCCVAAGPGCDTNCDGDFTPCASCDTDGDGACGADDCAPNDPTIYKGAPEKCDDGIDQDCVGGDLLCTAIPALDKDKDGYAAPADCNDSNVTIYPHAQELCDNLDNDCDGITDEGDPFGGQTCGLGAAYCQGGAYVCTHYGYGAILECQGAILEAPETCDGIDNNCSGGADEPWPELGTTCDGPDADSCENGVFICKGDGSGVLCDTESVLNLVEVCNGIDDDCDGATDEFACNLDDLDNDGVTSAEGDCDDYRVEVYPGAPEPCCDPTLGAAGAELCDFDCDGVIIPCGLLDKDADGVAAGAGDCDDTDPHVYPGAPEYCGDGIDQDCVGGDLDCATITDIDLDHFSAGDDCNDVNHLVNPWASEVCNFIDDDCDGLIDDGNPTGKTGSCGPSVPECAPGEWVCIHDVQTYTVKIDCVNENYQADELCNGLDDDCDGESDETFHALGEPCDGADADQCENGTKVCNTAGTGVICGVEIWTDIEEVCDALDNDCDGATDEELSWNGVALGDLCDGAGTCGTGVAICNLFLQPTCSTNPDGPFSQAMLEGCNGLDDDCDGLTDEDFLIDEIAVGGPCAGVGACGSGIVECLGADSVVCSSNPGGSVSESTVELCNTIDDDCDGETDEGLSQADSTCLQAGVCAGTSSASCADGEWACVYSGIVGWQAEETLCDGIDNDCDGETDEGWSLGSPCDGDDSDSCTNGAIICAATPDATICGPETVTDISETCDGVDNDCDGATDELVVDPGEAGCNTTGLCGESAWAIEVSCGEAGVVCVYSGIAGWQTEETFCDGIDNDCDGLTDEGVSLGSQGLGEPCEGKGACGQGLVECNSFSKKARCSTEWGGSEDESADELCDGLDNDCDGDTDEGFSSGGSGLSEACNPPGICAAGVVECTADGSKAVCSTGPGGSADGSLDEACNGVDDDCNGLTDEAEALDMADAGCFFMGVCADPLLGAVCQDGEWDCEYGLLEGWEQSETTCDDIDNDCDGDTDENQPFKGVSCDGSDADLCATGSWTCKANGLGLECVNETGEAVAEICDGVDNNCDGFTDEGLTWNGTAKGLPCDGVGACSIGLVVCALDGTPTCSTNPNGTASQAIEELCNELDDDCDGSTDEALTWNGSSVGGSCDGEGGCGNGIVICSPIDGAPTCSTNPNGTAPQTQIETCNGIDDDCDGMTDEDYAQLGERCDSESDVDFCKTGFLACVTGAPTCVKDIACIGGSLCLDPGVPSPQWCACGGKICNAVTGDSCVANSCTCAGGPSCASGEVCTATGCE